MPRKTSTAPATPAAKKPKTPRAKVGTTTAVTEAKRAQALKMLLEGHKCPAIGAALGVSRERAWQLADEALEQLKAETLNDAARWRLVLTARHNEAHRSLADLAVAAKAANDLGAAISAIDKQRAVAIEVAKLWGANAATTVKTELTGKDGGAVAVTTRVAPDLSNLTDEQLAMLETVTAAMAPKQEDE